MRFELWVTDELCLKVFAVLSSGEDFVNSCWIRGKTCVRALFEPTGDPDSWIRGNCGPPFQQRRPEVSGAVSVVHGFHINAAQDLRQLLPRL